MQNPNGEGNLAESVLEYYRSQLAPGAPHRVVSSDTLEVYVTHAGNEPKRVVVKLRPHGFEDTATHAVYDTFEALLDAVGGAAHRARFADIVSAKLRGLSAPSPGCKTTPGQN